MDREGYRRTRRVKESIWNRETKEMYEQMQGPMIYHMFITVFWSRDYRHMTTSLMKFANGEQNVAYK